MKRRVIRGNPLRNRAILKKLNPHSAVLKSYARAVNAKRRAARQVLLRKRSGAKVAEAELKKAQAVLGLKGTSAKEFRKELKQKVAKTKATLEKIEAAKQKRSEEAKARAANPRKAATKKGKK